MPLLKDSEYDLFVLGQPPHSHQMLIVCVTCQNLYPPAPGGDAPEQLYRSRNEHRMTPCAQSQVDSFRLVRYEISIPRPCYEAQKSLLQQRHNAAPGTVLMYIKGKLVFIGYIDYSDQSCPIRDIEIQISKARGDYRSGLFLPPDFKFRDKIETVGAKHVSSSIIQGDEPKKSGLSQVNSLVKGLHKPPVAPKPKVAPSPACTRKEGLSLPSPATAQKPKPLPAPKPVFPKAAGSPNPNRKLTRGPDGTLGLLNSQNGLQQENKRPNWDYIIPICLCSNEKCKCIKNETFAKLEKDLTRLDLKKVVSDNIVDKNEPKSPTLENACQNNSTGKSSNTVNNIYSLALTNGPSFPHKVQEEAKTNVIQQTASEFEPKEERASSSSKAVPNSAPARKPPPVPIPRKPKGQGVVEQEKLEDEIRNQEVSERSSEVKNCSSVPVNTPALTHLNAPAHIPRPTWAPPAPPPRNKAFLSYIGKGFSSEDVEEEDLGWDVNETELSVNKSDGECDKEADCTEEPIYNSVESLDGSPIPAKEEEVVIKLAPQKPPRRNSPMGRRMEVFENKDDKLSCPLIDQTDDGEVFNPAPEPQEYYEDNCVYEEIEDYVNVNVREEETSQWEEDVWPSPPPNNDDEGLYEDQEPYIKLEKNIPAPLEIYDYPRDFSTVDMAEERASDEDVLGNTTDDKEDKDEFDTSSTSSKGGEPEVADSATLIRRKNKIQHIATEIMTSENVFVDVLKLLHVDFRNAVNAASRQNEKPVIEERLLDQILYYLPQLYELNQQLLKELRERVSTWGANSKVADIFVKKGAFLKLYSNYIREFDKNVALLEEQTKKNLAFGAVVRTFEASPCCANLALRHYLLKPVQRIPQYQMLLTDYLKNLSEDSADYKDTQDALVIVKEVANHANDIMKQGDIFQKLIRVQCRLTGNHEIVQPGRVFLKEGVVNKHSRKSMQPRMIFLFNDMLLYTAPGQTGQFKVKEKLSLVGMKVKKPTREAFQNELIIESVERSFICSVSSATERDKWLEAISTAIRDFTKKKTSFVPGQSFEEVEIEHNATLGSKAPIWVPDPRATMCMICTCEFTLTWRRHHCRACGKMVCQSCSANIYRLKYLKWQWARVCDQCFVVLRKQENEHAISSSVGNKNIFRGKTKKIPAHLREVPANTIKSTMSGYLERIKPNKKQGKRLWFVIKEMVLYTYAASEDVAALNSKPLLGFTVKSDTKLQFRLLHKGKPFYIFKADNEETTQRWIEAMIKASVLDP
ncbi:FYVE, RhoGEF and PH domain-containing protein 6-like [Eucyclogobius newberryi]|uniref:FYVE, RhoGEF and PH domain-containing protein 6-like n=1 Tax=Eucyclogobius newberryi TaxID=166745 RepID=UPI003B59CDB9